MLTIFNLLIFEISSHTKVKDKIKITKVFISDKSVIKICKKNILFEINFIFKVLITE